ncbi:hypothetical protein EDC96DRAFT_547034 [Choanephora cucurbitarum]|nr:hypothetical protein EDC96DRAFT_547034 [Choanephora cucurbitarum]
MEPFRRMNFLNLIIDASNNKLRADTKKGSPLSKRLFVQNCLKNAQREHRRHSAMMSAASAAATAPSLSPEPRLYTPPPMRRIPLLSPLPVPLMAFGSLPAGAGTNATVTIDTDTCTNTNTTTTTIKPVSRTPTSVHTTTTITVATTTTIVTKVTTTVTFCIAPGDIRSVYTTTANTETSVATVTRNVPVAPTPTVLACGCFLSIDPLDFAKHNVVGKRWFKVVISRHLIEYGDLYTY